MARSPTKSQLPRDRQVDPESYQDFNPLSADAETGEYLEVDDDPDAIILEDAPDGGLLAPPLDDEKKLPGPTNSEGFYANLAEYLPEQVQQDIVQDLLDKIENDKESRKKRDESYAEGIRRTGLGSDAPGGAEFEGASRAVHPMMVEACIDYESRVVKELWPPSGPVKPKIIGAVTTAKVEQANRVTEHLNYQLTTEMPEARSVMEVTLTQVPLGGSQYIHLWYDHRMKRPRCEFRSIDNIYIPPNSADFYSASRKTYADTISELELKQRIRAGVYVDVDVTIPGEMPEESQTKQANDKVEGIDEVGDNIDNDRRIYEVSTYLDITEEMAEAFGELPDDCGCFEEEGQLLPYLITIDPQSRRILSLYRNWEDGDSTHEPIQWDFEFPFIPWRGAFGIGFPQLIGSLSAAATGALRALLDSAHANNAFGGLILKGSGAGGQTIRPQIGEFAEIDGGLETKDIRSLVMPFSPTQPSPVLFQLLGFVAEAARGVVRTSMDDGPSNAPVPVGTQMARLEEGLVVFSAIHGRAHAAFNRFLAGLHRLNRLYLPEMIKIDIEGKELIVRRKDYEGPCIIQGVSDPTIYSDQQRFAQLNWIGQRVQQYLATGVNMYKLREVELAGLRLMKWPNPEGLLVDTPEPQELNSTNENLSMALGQPVMVFPDQDHMAHLQVHLDFMKSPVFGMNPLIAPKFLPSALQHAAEHLSYLYVSTTVEVLKASTDGKDPSELMSKAVDVKRAFDGLLAQASHIAVPELEQMLQGVMPVLQQAQQLLQTMMPPPPMDPTQAAIKAAQMETDRKAKDDQAKAQLSAQEMQAKTQMQQQDNQVAAQKNQQASENVKIQAMVDAQTAELKARTDLQIAGMQASSAIENTLAETDANLEIAHKQAEVTREANPAAQKSSSKDD